MHRRGSGFRARLRRPGRTARGAEKIAGNACAIVPARGLAPGAWPKRQHRGRGTPREPRCRPVNARDPIPAAPAASTGHGPRPVPSFSSRRLCDVPVLRRPAKRSQARRTRLRNPRSMSVAFQPFARLVVGGSAGCVGSAQRRVGAGAFLHPPGKLPPGLTPATETRPVPARRPGRWRLRATDAGAAPPPDPPGQPPGGPPKDAPGSLPDRRGQVAANEHKIGTLSRDGGAFRPAHTSESARPNRSIGRALPQPLRTGG